MENKNKLFKSLMENVNNLFKSLMKNVNNLFKSLMENVNKPFKSVMKKLNIYQFVCLPQAPELNLEILFYKQRSQGRNSVRLKNIFYIFLALFWSVYFTRPIVF